jgi:hypothetical protein
MSQSRFVNRDTAKPEKASTRNRFAVVSIYFKPSNYFVLKNSVILCTAYIIYVEILYQHSMISMQIIFLLKRDILQKAA